MNKRVLDIVGWGFFLAGLLAGTAARGQEKSLEYPAKAAIVFHTIQFTEWPAGAFRDAQAAIVVGLVGEDVYRGALGAAIDGKSAWNRPLVFRHYAKVEDIGPCHVLVISASEQPRLAAALSKLDGKPVLTVSDIPHFMPAGGMMRVYIEENKPRFEVRIKAVERAGLKISSKLLKLAKIHPE